MPGAVLGTGRWQYAGSLWCLVEESVLLSLPDNIRIPAETGSAKVRREGEWRASGVAFDLVKEENAKGL